MFAQAHFPFTLSGELLDEYLEKGWFRMGQTIFTTNFLHFKDEFFSAIWLRIDLHKHSFGNTFKKLQKQNSSFRIDFRPAVINQEKEKLYKKYREAVSFEASSSLQQLMFGSAVFNIYNTYEIVVYHGDKLIGCGFFDLGKQTAAGISSFYDPEYRRYSLGKYIIQNKIDFCKTSGKSFFYPGYFVPGYPAFNYKLDLVKSGLEYFDMVGQKWNSIQNFSSKEVPYTMMSRQLENLQTQLHSKNAGTGLYNYAFFDANILIDSNDTHFLDYPLLVLLPSGQDNSKTVVVYNLLTRSFDMLHCQSFPISHAIQNAQNVFSSHLLRVEHTIFSTDAEEKMCRYIIKEFAEKSARQPDRLF